MKHHARLLVLTLGLAATGCSSLSEHNDATISSLESPELPEVTAATPQDNRAAAMRHYQAFLDESSDNRFVPEAMRRLADIYQAEEQEAVMQGTSLPGSTNSRAAELYAELLQRFPQHERNDSALYQLARAHEQSGDLQPSMLAMTRYSTDYPGANRYDEVQFRRGEYLFTRRDYAGAELAYLAVLDRGTDSVFHRQALYKIGWARFKQDHYETALDAYIQLLDESIVTHASASLPDNLERAEQERVEDTLRAVSLSFSYLGDSTEIRNYFSNRGPREYEPLLYAKLAALYLSKERYTDAAESYRLFARVHPQHREAPLFQSRVIDVFKQAGFSSRVLEEKQAFVERYQPASDYWKERDPAAATDVMRQVQRHLADVAQHYHARALEVKNTAGWDAAGKWYRLYLSSFRNSERAPYMNFLYAELLTSADRDAQAAAEYEQTAYAYGSYDKAAEAGYAAVLAYRKHEARVDAQHRPDWHRRSIDSSLRFAAAFPTHEYALPVRTLAARQLYVLGDYQAAIEAARPVSIDTRASQKLRTTAWTVIAHAQFDLHDFEQAEAAYQQVLAQPGHKKSEYAKLQEKLAASIYKQGEQARERGELNIAAQHFLRIAGAVPASGINTTAQYDAAAAYIALKNWPDAIRILERWRQNNPQHQLNTDVTRKLAVLYQENKQPVQAAAEFGRIAEREKDPALRREALWTMAGLYEQARMDRQSITAWKNYIRQFPQPLEPSLEARYKLVLLYGKAGVTDKQRYWQKQIIATDRNAGRQRSDRSRFLAAHAQLALTAADLAAYQATRLREPLKKNLARKQKYLQASIKGYKAAAAYQVSMVTTQATHEIGTLYRDFGKALMESERPGGLNAEELEQYEILLEEQAYPFEEKAIAVYETNAQRIPAGIYDKWVRKSMASLAELMPVRYAKQERGEKFVAVLQ